jgi:pyridoxal phosphate enzyme (YggS family)
MPENRTSGKMNLEQRLRQVVARVHAAELQYGREIASVHILPVSKTRSAEEMAAVADLAIPEVGQAFGENYVQEAVDKIAALADRNLQWHFIGPIQSNKTALIAQHFHWVHSVDRLKIAQRLNEQRPAGMPPLNVCLQVNVSGEASKSGIALDELPALAEQVALLPRLRLRGLMAIPAASEDLVAQRQAFHAVQEAFNLLKNPQHGKGSRGSWQYWDTLSMGMSGDLEMAIAEGATIVRVGTDIFGPRLSPKKNENEKIQSLRKLD